MLATTHPEEEIYLEAVNSNFEDPIASKYHDLVAEAPLRQYGHNWSKAPVNDDPELKKMLKETWGSGWGVGGVRRIGSYFNIPRNQTKIDDIFSTHSPLARHIERYQAAKQNYADGEIGIDAMLYFCLSFLEKERLQSRKFEELIENEGALTLQQKDDFHEILQIMQEKFYRELIDDIPEEIKSLIDEAIAQYQKTEPFPALCADFEQI